MYEVTMPKLSDSMETGQILEWKVKEGDEVHAGDVLAEIESDKATLELECFADGVMAKILHGDGAEVPVGEVIAVIGEAGPFPLPPGEGRVRGLGDIPAPSSMPSPQPSPGGRGSELQTRPPAAPAQAPLPRVDAPRAEAPPTTSPKAGRVAISPYARMLAHEKGLDYTKIKGTGPGGRITAHDVETAAVAMARPAERPAPRAEDELPPVVVTPDEAAVEDAPFRLKTQARIVTASKHLIPHFYMTRGADVTRLLARKDELKEEFGATVTHLILLACVKAVKEHPEVNRSYDRDRIITWKGIHLGIAVDTEQGLTVAVLRDAQALSLREIVERSRALAEKARAGKLSAEERKHPTLTVTNLGMFDVEHFEPIINPPSSITLGVASALQAPVIRNDAIHIARVMRLTLSCDHRIIEGVTAARFLKTLKDLLENPDALLG